MKRYRNITIGENVGGKKCLYDKELYKYSLKHSCVQLKSGSPQFPRDFCGAGHKERGLGPCIREVGKEVVTCFSFSPSSLAFSLLLSSEVFSSLFSLHLVI